MKLLKKKINVLRRKKTYINHLLSVNKLVLSYLLLRLLPHHESLPSFCIYSLTAPTYDVVSEVAQQDDYMQSWAQLPLSVDPLINGAALIFHFKNVNLTEERLFLNLYKASALKIQFCRISKT